MSDSNAVFANCWTKRNLVEKESKSLRFQFTICWVASKACKENYFATDDGKWSNLMINDKTWEMMKHEILWNMINDKTWCWCCWWALSKAPVVYSVERTILPQDRWEKPLLDNLTNSQDTVCVLAKRIEEGYSWPRTSTCAHFGFKQECLRSSQRSSFVFSWFLNIIDILMYRVSAMY